MGFPHTALEGQGRTDCSPDVAVGVWTSRTHSSECCLDQAGKCMGRKVWRSLVWRVQVSSRAQKHPLPVLLSSCDSCSLGRSPWWRWPRGQPARPLCTCWPCSPCSSRPPLPGKDLLSLTGGRGTWPEQPFALHPAQSWTPASTDASAPDTSAECWAPWVDAGGVVRSQCGQGGAVNQSLLLLQGGCFPALGVFGCCCSVGCGVVRTQCLSPGPCVSGLRR